MFLLNFPVDFVDQLLYVVVFVWQGVFETQGLSFGDMLRN